MNCEDAREFVSALCDGELLPPDAAEHIGKCNSCRELTNEYLKIGIELRRSASLVASGEVRTGAWKDSSRKTRGWWGKGWETMRIPRFAFALLLVTVMALGSGLVMSKVRAQSHGTVLMLTYKLPDGKSGACPLSLVDEKNNLCAMLGAHLLLGLKTLSHQQDQIELGVRLKYTEQTAQLNAAGVYILSMEDLNKIEEKHYWLTPGQDLQIDVAGWGTMLLSGELMDHMPSYWDPTSVQMDPKPGMLQVVSPFLLQDKRVLFDFENSASINKGVQMYVPGKGLWTISLSPMDGGVEAKVSLNRVSFELEGHSYMFLMAAPVARSDEHVWVLHDPNYDARGTSGFIGPVGLADAIRRNVENQNQN